MSLPPPRDSLALQVLRGLGYALLAVVTAAGVTILFTLNAIRQIWEMLFRKR